MASRSVLLPLVAAIGCTGSVGGDGTGPGSGAGESSPRGTDQTPRAGGGGTAGTTMGGGPSVTAPPATLTCNRSTKAATLQRLVRLTSNQYVNTVNAFVAGRGAASTKTGAADAVSSPFQFVNPADRFETYSGTYGMTDDELRLAVDSAATAAGRLVTALTAPGGAGACIAAATPAIADCLKPIVADRGSILFRRPLTDAEVAKYTKVATDAQTALGNRKDAATLAFQAMLIAPQFVFRVELGADKAEPDQRHRLTSYEVAAAIAYTLTDAPPDAMLWSAAAADQLTTPDQIQAHVARLLDPIGTQPAVLRFFEQYFHFPLVSRAVKDPKLYPDYHPDLLAADTDLYVRDLLGRAAKTDFVRTLLTDSSVFVRCQTAANFGLTPAKDCTPHREAAPAGQRSGVLTQPAFLATYSAADDNKPVQRGRFIRESLLCGQVPDIPIAMIPPLKDLGPDATLRDRLAMHSQGTCRGCHGLMDPMGLTFEQFDHTGKYRTTIKGKPVDATGELVGSGAGDGPVANAIELTTKLAQSPTVEQCFVRQSLRYWVGRPDEDSDACAIADAEGVYQKTGGNLVELVKALFVSDAFLYRKVQP